MEIDGKLENLTAPAVPKPLNRWPLNLAWVMMSGTPTHMQNFIRSDKRFLLPAPAPAQTGATTVGTGGDWSPNF